MFIDRFLPFQSSELSFITTSAIEFYIEKMFENAKKKIIIISPYIKINLRIYDILQNRKNNNVDITIVYREEFEHANIATNLFKRKNLHAKCFFTENAAIIGSMNLYDYSQINNDEMAIYLTKINNEKLYNDISKEVIRLCSEFNDINTINNSQYINDKKNGLKVGNKYERLELNKYFSFIDNYPGGIKQTRHGNVVLFSYSGSKYINKEKDGILYYMGQNTGTDVQMLRYGNKALYDIFTNGIGRIFLFKNSIFCGEYVICSKPFLEDGKWIFPLKPRKKA